MCQPELPSQYFVPQKGKPMTWQIIDDAAKKEFHSWIKFGLNVVNPGH